VDRLESWEQLEAQEPAECKGDLALPVTVNVLPVDAHLSDVMQDAFDHRGDF
jgi:hypothetical protein